MNNQFKSEFKNLNIKEIKELVNRCAGQDILLLDENDIFKAGFVKYIEDDNYGFWNVQWGWKTIKHNNILLGGDFQFRIKITPFKIEFENTHSTLNTFSKTHNRKLLEDHIPIYINKKCPHYQQAIIEEAKNFVQYLNMGNNDEKGRN